MHATAAKITVTKIYMYLWHVCLVMTNFFVTNWIWDSGATCHMTPEVSDFISGSLEDSDKYIEFADRNHVTAKQKVRNE